MQIEHGLVQREVSIWEPPQIEQVFYKELHQSNLRSDKLYVALNLRWHSFTEELLLENDFNVV